MTISELKRRYKQGAPVDVLAELADCSVRDIFFALGLKIAPEEMLTRDITFMALYEQGMTDREIAQEAKCSKSLVHQWRAKNGLPHNGRRKKVQQEEAI